MHFVKFQGDISPYCIFIGVLLYKCKFNPAFSPFFIWHCYNFDILKIANNLILRGF